MNQKNILTIVLILWAITMVLTLLFAHLYVQEKEDKEYYRIQMESFCEISVLETDFLQTAYPDEEWPDLAPCEQWRLGWDK